MAILFTTLLLGAISYSRGYGDYLCNYYKNITSSHTACLPLKSPRVTASEKQAILDFHNRLRSYVFPAASNMLKMTWDDKLADLAQRWVGTCPNGHDNKFDRYLFGYYTVGQNLAGGSDTTWLSIMTLWENERYAWSYWRHPVANTGNYTQMIWAQSYKIGCAMTKMCTGDNPDQYVCNYGPAGNAVGQKPYSFRSGMPPGSDCKTSSGTLCDCGQKMCRNFATLNVGTCNCDCHWISDRYTEGDSCRINCNTVVDYSFCGKSFYVNSYCKVNVYMPVAVCPKLCKVCPAITNLY